ncbi:MAG: amidohydrolase [Bacteroidetes bacterium]|nr:MAG: amidohydrolase [Bacteroidota bacterium]
MKPPIFKQRNPPQNKRHRPAHLGMAYRKLQADALFDGSTLHHNKVLVTTANGTIIDVVEAGASGTHNDDVEHHSGWLCPGFVNAHCHTELSHMQGSIPAGTGMVPFLQQVVLGRAAPQQAIQHSMALAVAAMYKNGIQAVGDVCNTNNGFAIKAASPLHFHHFFEVSGFVPATAHQRLQPLLQLQQQWAQQHGGPSSVVPHAPYSVSQPLLQLLAQLGPAISTIHHMESAAEMAFMAHKTGPMLGLFEALGIPLHFFEPLEQGVAGWLKPYFESTPQLVLVHNCHTSEEHVEFLQALNQQSVQGASAGARFYWCLCPNANLYIGNPLPNVPLLAASGLPICVGTDSLASNQQLCILFELQTLQAQYAHLSTTQLLQWATLTGAMALGLQQQLGSFAPGKKPGILLLQGLNALTLQQGRVQRLA